MVFVDKYAIREMNETIVLEHIVNQGPLSRAAVANNTHLSKASVSEIVRKLTETNLVHEIGIGDSTTSGGRRPIMLELNKHAGVSLSFDIGYNYIATMLTYLDGEIITEQIIEDKINRETLIDKIENVVIDYQQMIPKTSYGIVGITIAIHGVVYDNSIVFTPYYDLAKLNICEVLGNRLGIPIFIENEANLSAIAEQTYSSNYKNLVSISIHSGIGAGIIIDGELYTGERGFSGEIGHKILFPDGKPCPCGNRGCLEQYCSEKSILEFFTEGNQPTETTIAQLKSAYLTKDPKVTELIDRAAKYLAIGINNVTTAFSPGVIFLKSRLTREIPDFLEKINSNLNSFINEDVELRNSTLGDQATLLGASAVSIRNFLRIKSMKIQR
ncbi:ROK family transcriptional regulator [Mesobacillus maritimus]|uniref:ROK family transcriptional regulator n=1 Tax=Mesobacillus maritimus TaxID=1643336 RepID=A0ABS7KAQ4_9BACI|nr:ROK family transcriptional regulator [Mesobacillus maritimus]MBY0099332.1 ROK family transcriptional regulator [Mesobacillus maritimus]